MLIIWQKCFNLHIPSLICRKNFKVYCNIQISEHHPTWVLFLKDRMVIPPKLRSIIHKTEICSRKSLRHSMASQIKYRGRNCDIYFKFSRNQQKLPIFSHPNPEALFEIASIAVNHYSNFFESEKLKNLSAKWTELFYLVLSCNDFYGLILIERFAPNKTRSSPVQRLFLRNLRCTTRVINHVHWNISENQEI